MAKKADILARRVNRYLRLSEKLKPQYQKLDSLMEKILSSGMKVNQVAGNGILRDRFGGKNTAWKSVKFDHLHIERVAT